MAIRNLDIILSRLRWGQLTELAHLLEPPQRKSLQKSKIAKYDKLFSSVLAASWATFEKAFNNRNISTVNFSAVTLFPSCFTSRRIYKFSLSCLGTEVNLSGKHFKMWFSLIRKFHPKVKINKIG